MIPLLLKFLALLLGFALWAALGYLGKVPLDPLIALLQMGLGGLITHMLQDGAPVKAEPVPTPTPPTQGGFASLRLLLLVAAGALLACLAGCTTTTSTLYAGYATAAEKGVKSADDNLIATWRALACATPLSAVLRNPEIIPGLKALCLPGGNASDPSALLEGKAPITINLTLPAAAASGAK